MEGSGIEVEEGHPLDKSCFYAFPAHYNTKLELCCVGAWLVFSFTVLVCHYAMLFFHVYTCTVEPQWLEHIWNHENMFETGVVRANEY